ncbi:MAG: alkaline phosphatase [Candidatus Sumerlaeia bacterium]|nr:alkaline phosphatase [Candidatus Sumerlaeia bacterium]
MRCSAKGVALFNSCFVVRGSWFATMAIGLLLSTACSEKGSGELYRHENDPTRARNVILFVGDGMGDNQATATAIKRAGQKLDADGNPPHMAWERFPILGLVTTFAADGYVTDSASSATTLATGHKTYNAAIGLSEDKQPLETVAEVARASGKFVGIVSSVPINHATPGAFYAKSETRQNYDEIATHAFTTRTADVNLGGDLKRQKLSEADLLSMANEHGKLLFTLDNLADLTPEVVGTRDVVGYFAADKDEKLTHDPAKGDDNAEPSLTELVLRTLEISRRNDNGFFLMIEGGAIDWGGHANKIEDVIHETLEFERAIVATMEWLDARGELDDTLIVVTADHETGGLTLLGSYSKLFGEGTEPTYGWSTGGHTAANVPLWARGPGSRRLAGKLDNTHVAPVLKTAVRGR